MSRQRRESAIKAEEAIKKVMEEGENTQDTQDTIRPPVPIFHPIHVSRNVTTLHPSIIQPAIRRGLVADMKEKFTARTITSMNVTAPKKNNPLDGPVEEDPFIQRMLRNRASSSVMSFGTSRTTNSATHSVFTSKLPQSSLANRDLPSYKRHTVAATIPKTKASIQPRSSTVPDLAHSLEEIHIQSSQSLNATPETIPKTFNQTKSTDAVSTQKKQKPGPACKTGRRVVAATQSAAPGSLTSAAKRDEILRLKKEEIKKRIELEKRKLRALDAAVEDESSSSSSDDIDTPQAKGPVTSKKSMQNEKTKSVGRPGQKKSNAISDSEEEYINDRPDDIIDDDDLLSFNESSEDSAPDDMPPINYKDMEWFDRVRTTCQYCDTKYATLREASNCIVFKHGRNRCYVCFTTHANSGKLFNHYRLKHSEKGMPNEHILCPFCPTHKLQNYRNISVHIVQSHCKPREEKLDRQAARKRKMESKSSSQSSNTENEGRSKPSRSKEKKSKPFPSKPNASKETTINATNEKKFNRKAQKSSKVAATPNKKTEKAKPVSVPKKTCPKPKTKAVIKPKQKPKKKIIESDTESDEEILSDLPSTEESKKGNSPIQEVTVLDSDESEEKSL